jgi:CRISPR/Cas system CSM-associated protein Csm3 (group 7 of RAMP superfamily)
MSKIKYSGNNLRYLARFIIEAETPLAVGAGDGNMFTDSQVALDANGLPYIPGTAIVGVIRHMIKDSGSDLDVNALFGFQSKNDGYGSKVIFTSANVLDSKGNVIDGLNTSWSGDELLKHYYDLPIRQHVRINHKGVTDKNGKFDNEVVYAGTRFCFEIEMVASSDSEFSNFREILKQTHDKSFRLGGGTRCGYGEIKVISLYTCQLDLCQADELNKYLAKPSILSLSGKWNGWVETAYDDNPSKLWTEYILELNPADFFLFSSGLDDEDADITPVRESIVKWTNGLGKLSDQLTLIPATSVKGAISHRTAYYYNKLKKIYSVAENDINNAVVKLFGSDNQSESSAEVKCRGSVLFSDLYIEKSNEKVLNHIKIDRYTGGGIDGALFSEKVTYGKNSLLELKLLVENTALQGDVCTAFEMALKSLCAGMLPLGGGVNRGNGVFIGKLIKNGDVIYEGK